MSLGRLLILGSGRHQVPLIQKAEAAGYRTVIADNKPGSPGRRFCSFESDVSATDVAACRRLAIEHEVKGILTTGTDQPVRVMAALSQELGLPCYITPEAAEAATNKAVQRQVLQRAGVRQPAFLAFHSSAGSPPAWSTFPCVVKPADSQGQRGVKIVNSAEELALTIEESSTHASEGEVVIEEFIEGQEITANAWISRGQLAFLALSDRITYSAHCLGICFQHVFPSLAAVGWEKEVAEMAGQIGKAFGIINGPLYIQMIISKQGPRLVEAAARVGGGHEAQLLPRICGFDPHAQLLTGLSGQSYEGDSCLPAATHALVNFVFAHAGTVASCEGMQGAANHGIAEADYYVTPGANLSGMLDGQGRVGYFLATGSSRQKIETKAVQFYLSLAVKNGAGQNLVFLPHDHELARPTVV